MTLHLSGFAFITNTAVVTGARGAGVALDCARIAEAVVPAVPGQAVNQSWVWIVPLGQRTLPDSVTALAQAAAAGPVDVDVTWDGCDGCPDLRFEAVRQTIPGLHTTGFGTDALVVVRAA